MSVRDIEIALEPFGQVNRSLYVEENGSGLELPLAKQLVELHGGRLKISSEPGGGTEVEVQFDENRWREDSGKNTTG